MDYEVCQTCEARMNCILEGERYWCSKCGTQTALIYSERPELIKHVEKLLNLLQEIRQVKTLPTLVSEHEKNIEECIRLPRERKLQ